MVLEGENVFRYTKEVANLYFLISTIFQKEMREISRAQFLSFGEISIVNVAFMFDSRYEIFFGKRN